jgi:membrane associated rhomboid family serine protease
MVNASHPVRDELYGVLLFVGAMWGVFLVSLALPSLDSYGVVPRTLVGLVGIPAMPFLHADLHHIVSNTLPLIILLMLLAGSKARSWEIVIEVVLLGGFLLWLFGRRADHIGASGLIFGLAAFLVVSGLLERRIVPLMACVTVALLYGGTLLSGVLPRLGSHVSWDGHLCGAAAGGVIAYALTREPKARPTPDGQGEQPLKV